MVINKKKKHETIRIPKRLYIYWFASGPNFDISLTSHPSSKSSLSWPWGEHLSLTPLRAKNAILRLSQPVGFRGLTWINPTPSPRIQSGAPLNRSPKMNARMIEDVFEVPPSDTHICLTWQYNLALCNGIWVFLKRHWGSRLFSSHSSPQVSLSYHLRGHWNKKLFGDVLGTTSLDLWRPYV